MLQPKVALRAAVLLLAAQAHAFTFTEVCFVSFCSSNCLYILHTRLSTCEIGIQSEFFLAYVHARVI